MTDNAMLDFAPSTALRQLNGELEQKRDALGKLFAEHKDADGRYNLTPEQAEDVRRRNDELTDLGKKRDAQRDAEVLEFKNRRELEYLQTPVHPSRHSDGRDAGRLAPDVPPPARKSLAEHVIESPQFKAAYARIQESGGLNPFKVAIPDFDTKTTMTETSAGFAPPNYRTNVVVFSAQRRPVVADLIPQDPTDLQTVKYMLETTYTNNAAMAAEATTAGESALAFTEQSATVEWLPTILPITDQQLEDVPQLSSLINNRLTLMVGQSEEIQLLSGNGTSPQLGGFLNVSGVQTQAVGSDPIPDAIMKAMTLVRFTGFADPSGIVIHPANWQTIRLLKTSTGAYIWGDPASVGPERVFGMPAIVTPAITQNTALLGDFTGFSQIYRRRGLVIEVGYVNDDFKKGQKTLRASERLCLICYRPAAFATVTGLS